MRWFAPHAWLGGADLAANVEIESRYGRIVSVTTDTTPRGAHRLGGIVVPGLVSAHSHAFHRALRGKTHRGPGDFWTWRDSMYRVAARLDPENYRRLAGEVFAEMLRAGITTVGEFHYVHHRPDGSPYGVPGAMEQALIGAALDTGIRMTLLDACYLTSDVDGSPPSSSQQRFSDGSAENWRDRVERIPGMTDSPVIKLGVAAHSVRAVPPAALKVVAQVGAAIGGPVHVHLSEQVDENEACRRAHGISPTQLMENTGMLGGTTTMVHATHMEADDIGSLAGTGTGVCLCPTTERDLGDGIGPAREYADASIALSLGSDSNAIVDVLEEARAVELNDRLRLHRRGVHAAESLMEAATSNGLAALGWGRHGSLAPGSPADLIVISIDSVSAAGFHPDDGIGGLLFSAGTHMVTDVIVGGSAVVEDAVNVSEHSPAGLHAAIRAVTR